MTINKAYALYITIENTVNAAKNLAEADADEKCEVYINLDGQEEAMTLAEFKQRMFGKPLSE